MRIDQVLKIIRPGATWRLVGLEYEGLEWLDAEQEKPTKEEIDVAINLHSYTELRKKEYPPIGDQLDAIWKGGVHAENMKALIQAVKDKYPKP